MISILLNSNMKEIAWKKMSIHISLGYRYLIFFKKSLLMIRKKKTGNTSLKDCSPFME